MSRDQELQEYFAVLTLDGRWTGRIVGRWGVVKDAPYRFQSLGKTDSIEKARTLAERLWGKPTTDGEGQEATGDARPPS